MTSVANQPPTAPSPQSPSSIDGSLSAELLERVTAIRAALGEAIEKQSNETVECDPSPPIESASPTLDFKSLVVAVAGARDRVEASTRIIAAMTVALPDHTIRIAWGKRSPKDPETVVLQRLLDSRLGWLGVDNSIRQRLSSQWCDRPDQSLVRLESHGLTLCLSLDATSGEDGTRDLWEGRLWIIPPLNHPARVQSLASSIDPSDLRMLANVLHSRPSARRWAALAKRINEVWAYRALIVMVFLALGIIAMFPRKYPVQAVASVTARDSRVIAAPLEGALLIAHVRPGDFVRAGQAIIELDGRPLRIEAEALSAEFQQAIKDEDIALAGGQIAQAQLAGLKRQSLGKRMELVESRLAQLILTSPIDGIVIQGDLQRMIGTTVTTGQTLMEVAPKESLEIELEIPEIEIGMVGHHSKVRMWFPAAGGQTHETELQSIWPAATVREDRNVFVGQASLPPSQAALRVGMVGDATLYGPTRPLAWRWLRTPIRRIAWMMGV